MACLDSIVTTGYCGTTPTSGLTLKDAPEISSINLENIANEDQINGKQLAQDKLNLAIKLVQNDFMSQLAASNVLPSVSNTNYETGIFKTNTIIAPEAIERGLSLIKNSRTYGNLRKLTIHTISVYPLQDATGVTVRIYDDYAGGMVSTYNFDLVANEINNFDVEYTVKGTFARVVMVGAGSVADSYLNTCAGCSGTMPNDCGYTKTSYNGVDGNGKSGYGLNLTFSCKCDYEELLCGMSQTFIGQLIWLKARILLMEALMHTSRNNNWTTFDMETMADYLATVKSEYQTTWTTFTQSLPNVLKQYHDWCLNCKGMRFVTNI